MKMITALTCAGALLLGLSALAFQDMDRASASAESAGTEAQDCCGDSGCFDSATCGDEETLCPAGPDCFAPEVCLDKDMVCPADPEPAASAEPCTGECCASDA
jgi:hypothetical protein